MHYRGLIASHCTLYIHSIYPVISKSNLFDIYTQKAQTPFVAYRKSRPSLTYQTINNNETYADMTTRLYRNTRRV